MAEEEDRRMRSEKVTFPGSGGTQLAGRLDLPDAQPQAFALFAHCFTCSKDVLAASRIAQALTGYGIAVLRFDFTGLGGSDGDFANTNFTSNAAPTMARHSRGFRPTVSQDTDVSTSIAVWWRSGPRTARKTFRTG